MRYNHLFGPFLGFISAFFTFLTLETGSMKDLACSPFKFSEKDNKNPFLQIDNLPSRNLSIQLENSDFELNTTQKEDLKSYFTLTNQMLTGENKDSIEANHRVLHRERIQQPGDLYDDQFQGFVKNVEELDLKDADGNKIKTIYSFRGPSEIIATSPVSEDKDRIHLIFSYNPLLTSNNSVNRSVGLLESRGIKENSLESLRNLVETADQVASYLVTKACHNKKIKINSDFELTDAKSVEPITNYITYLVNEYRQLQNSEDRVLPPILYRILLTRSSDEASDEAESKTKQFTQSRTAPIDFQGELISWLKELWINEKGEVVKVKMRTYVCYAGVINESLLDNFEPQTLLQNFKKSARLKFKNSHGAINKALKSWKEELNKQKNRAFK